MTTIGSAAFIRRLLLPAAALALAASAPAAFAATPLPSQVGDREVPSLAPVIEQVSPSVVNIAVRGTTEVRSPFADDPFFRRFFDAPQGPQRREFRSAGSGVIVDADEGYVITNHHVIENAEEITVTLFNDRVLTAEVVGSDPGTDVALLRIDGNNLIAMTLGDSDATRVGDFVLAIGNPFGLQHTVTSGIVSALGRAGLNPDGYEDFIQTDASINPGNSGGALVNLHGELIGINSAIFTQRGGGNIGIGFAIPINMAKGVMDQIVEHGEVRRGLLGVRIASVTPAIAQENELGEARGALVTEVTPGSAAESAGIQIDDVIVRVNARRVDDAAQLRNAIGMLRVGDEVTIELLRDGERQSLTATLQESAAVTAATSDASSIDEAFEGAELANYDASRTDYIGQDGVLVTAVEEDSPAARRGLRSGDIVLAVNRNRVRDIAEFTEAVQGASAVILRVRRGNQNLLLPIR